MVDKEIETELQEDLEAYADLEENIESFWSGGWGNIPPKSFDVVGE